LTLANLGEIFTPNEVLFPIVSAGTGRSTGIEFSGEAQFSKAWFGRGNLSLARTRYAGTDGVLRDSAFDRRTTVHLTGGYRTEGAWTYTADFTWMSGRPYTPFDFAQSDAQRRPVYDTGHLLAGRLPSSTELDVRADWKKQWLGVESTVFVALLNVTNARNVAGYEWNRRTNALQTDREEGIFPMIGGEIRY
jgi:hypothetical protein